MTKEKIVITPVITKEQLRFEVDKLVYGDGMTYTESIIEICEKNGNRPGRYGKTC